MKQRQKTYGKEGVIFESKSEDGAILLGGSADNGSRSVMRASALDNEPSLSVKPEFTATNTLAKQYRGVCDAYMESFIQMADRHTYNWLKVGELVDCDGDIFDFAHIKGMVDGEYTVIQFFAWREYCLRVHELGLPDVSLEHFVKSENLINYNDIDRLEIIKRDFEKEVKKVKEEYGY